MQTYEQREASDLYRQIDNLEKEPFDVRILARMEWYAAMANELPLVAERLTWLFQGAYGKGSYDRAHAILKSRGNREAQLGQLLAAVEWMCAPSEARKAWNMLTDSEQRAVTDVFNNAIREYSNAAV